MWKKLLGTTLIAAFALSSCTDKDVYQGPKEDEKEFFPEVPGGFLLMMERLK